MPCVAKKHECDLPVMNDAGAGQDVDLSIATRELERAQSLYCLDRENTLRFSHENPAVVAAYERYFEKPLSHKALALLHTDHDAWKMPNEL